MKSLLILSLFFILACSTSALKHFDQVQKGMDKDQVLSLVGNPNRTERKNGMEKWSYRFFTEDDANKEILKFVKFNNGEVADFGNDEDELRRIRGLKQSAEKKEALSKKKDEVRQKVEDHYQNKNKPSIENEEN